MSHQTDAIVIHCIDFRFQHFIDGWLKKNLGHFTYDRVGQAGGIFDFFAILKQIEISNRLHRIKKVILINHEDCGAYGSQGTVERHTYDLQNAERIIEAVFPHLDVETYYLHIDGTFEEISKIKSRFHEKTKLRKSKSS